MRTRRGAQRVDPIRLSQLRIRLVQRSQMPGDGGRVTAGHGSGQRGLATLQGVLQRGAGQRSDDAFGDPARLVVHPLLPQQFVAAHRHPQRLQRIRKHRHQVIGGVRQRGVIEHARLLAHTERFAAHFQHQRRGDGIAHLVGGGDTEAGVGQPGDVLVGAGERHRRVNRQRNAAQLGQRRQDGDTVGAGSVRHDRARPYRRGGGQSGHQAGEFAVGDRQQQQLSSGCDVGGPSTGVSGSRRAARCRDACETALQATTTWSARSSATPSAVPTRPAEMIPTLSLAGRKPSNCSIADDLTVIFVRSSPAAGVPDGH